MNSAGFAAGMGNALPTAASAWQRILQGRLALQQAQRQQQAQEAMFAALMTPPAGAVPQQGPPGFAGMQPPTAAPGPASAGGGAPGPAAAPIPAGALSANAAAPPPPPASVPGRPGAPPAVGGPATAAGINVPDPVARLRQMAEQLKRANPNLDNATLAAALEQQVTMARGLAPDDRAILQAETQIMRIQSQADIAAMRAQSAIDAANLRADAAKQIADIRAEVAKRGQDVGADTHNKDRTSREGIAATAEAGRNARAAARIDQSTASAQVKAQYKQMQQQRAALKDQIAAFNAGTPGAPDKAKVAQLQQQLTQLDAQMANFWSRNQGLPRPSELDRMGREAPAAGEPGTEPSASTPSDTDPFGIR